MPAFEIEIKDFQAIKHVRMEFVDGVNIINGKTNNGKSAVFRAIDSALFNNGDDSRVRVGSRYSGIMLFNGTHRLIFRRDAQGRNEKTAYSLDGGPTITKVGRSQLPEVAKMFNIRDVRMQNGTKMKLNFWYQGDQPFLMDKTAGQLYEFLSLSSCENYSKALKRMGQDLKIMEAEGTSLETQIDTLRSVNDRKLDFIKKNEGFDQVYEQSIRLGRENDYLEKVEELLTRIQQLESQRDVERKRKDIAESRMSLIPITAISTKVGEAEASVQSLVKVRDSFNAWSKVYKEKQKAETLLQALSISLAKSETVVTRVGAGLDGISSEAVALDTLSKSLGEYQNLSNVLERNQAISGRVSHWVHSVDSVDAKSRINEYEQESAVLSKLERGITELSSLVDSKKKAQESIASVEASIGANRSDFEALKAETGFCPYCGTTFSGSEHQH